MQLGLERGIEAVVERGHGLHQAREGLDPVALLHQGRPLRLQRVEPGRQPVEQRFEGRGVGRRPGAGGLRRPG
jgi:hypothetical protein